MNRDKKSGKFSNVLTEKDMEWIDILLAETNEPLTKTAEKVSQKVGLSPFYAYQVVMKRYRQIKTKELTSK